ncbi:hypothetical protein H0B56_10110 [Haloechinothrix sp. YIM 98757]|uniref:Alpha/beta hydrolase n=1 Tax=Haloechinothrix aidingensis TaxID=2752311 RepID=A0A838A047_9PSEU|nr:hypothetical protein [Haloechinothrix aidingensis]MBA0125894.1 hypothetical protein [Haloechinothrix aidingensis]
MSEYATDPRGDGPTLVSDGPVNAPAVLVLDPAGAAKHEDIPASWHELLGTRHVVWCRMPAGDALFSAGEALAELADRHVTVDVVTSGPDAVTAMDFVRARADVVRALLLVDPAASGARLAHDTRGMRVPESPGADAQAADAVWEERYRARIAALADAGVAVRTVAHSPGGGRDRIPPPLPLGHPDVVERITGTLHGLDGETAGALAR